jgi:hypothetical protein
MDSTFCGAPTSACAIQSAKIVRVTGQFLIEHSIPAEAPAEFS